jgi:hypothetical protein
VGYSTAGSPPSPFLDDAQLRAGARLDLAVGDSVWAFASGTRGRAMTLAGTIDGHSLAVRRSGAKPGHAWLAVRPGTTTLTLTVDDEEGRRVRAGALTVVVRRGSDAPSTWRTSAGGTRR